MGWLDLIGVGLDILQYSEIKKTRDLLNSLDNRNLREAQRAEIISLQKNFVFDIMQSAKKLENYIDTYPTQVYVGAKVLEWRINAVGLSQENFTEFSDKQYFVDTTNQIEGLCRNSQQKLTPEQIKRADMAFRYIQEMPLLDEAIDMHDAQKGLREVLGELSQFRGIMLLGNVCLMAGVLISLLFILMGGLFEAPLFVSLFLGVPILLKVGIQYYVSSRGYKTLIEKRDQIEKKLHDKELQERIGALFGKETLASLNQMKQRRQAILKEVLGELSESGVLLPAPN